MITKLKPMVLLASLALPLLVTQAVAQTNWRCVSATGLDTNNGQSWSTPKRTIQAAANALASTGGEVRVKGYSDTTAYLNQHIHAVNGVSVKGCYTGNVDDAAERDTAGLVTVLSGTSSDCVIEVPSTVTSIAGTVLEYLTIKNGGGHVGAGGSYGGGIYCEGSPTMDHCTVSNNSANFGGGIYAAYGTSPRIVWSTIENNMSPQVANNCGVGIYMFGGILEDNIIRNNYTNGAYANGAGLYLGSYANPSSVARNTISGNGKSRSWSTKGGGVYASGCSSSLSLSSNIISGNHSGGGAGIYWSTPGTIRQNTITGNFGDGVPSAYGGGIYLNGNASVYSNVIANNTATTGAGVYSVSMASTCKFVNNTVVGHTSGSGIYLSSPVDGSSIANCIITSNSPYGVQASAGPCSLVHCCFYGNGADTYGSAVKDPYCLNNVAPLLDASFRIAGNSPCVDAGDDSAVQSGWKDIDGANRQVNMPDQFDPTNDPYDLVTVDIGANEIQDTTAPSFSSVAVDKTTVRIMDPLTITFVASEPLLCDPTVYVGGHTADCYASYGRTYSYRCDIQNTEASNASKIDIIGIDRNGRGGMSTFTSLITPIKSYKFERVNDTSKVYSANGASCLYTNDERYRTTEIKNQLPESGSSHHRSPISGAWINYTLDVAGNRVGIAFDGGSATILGYDVLNRLTSFGSTTFTYDWLGNRTSGGFTYDAVDRIATPSGYTYYETGSVETITYPTFTRTFAYDGRELLTRIGDD